MTQALSPFDRFLNKREDLMNIIINGITYQIEEGEGRLFTGDDKKSLRFVHRKSGRNIEIKVPIEAAIYLNAAHYMNVRLGLKKDADTFNVDRELEAFLAKVAEESNHVPDINNRHDEQ